MRNNLEINKNVFIADEWRLGWGGNKHLAVTLKGAVIHGKEYNGTFYAIQGPRDEETGASCAPYFHVSHSRPLSYELTEAAAKVLAAFTMKYAPPLVQLLTPEKIEERLEEERQRLNRAAALEVVGYGQEMRLN